MRGGPLQFENKGTCIEHKLFNHDSQITNTCYWQLAACRLQIWHKWHIRKIFWARINLSRINANKPPFVNFAEFRVDFSQK